MTARQEGVLAHDRHADRFKRRRSPCGYRAANTEAELRVLHVLLGGGIGGIEAHVASLCPAQRELGLASSIVCCFSGGEMTDRLEREGFRVYQCGCKSGHDPRLPFRLRRVVRAVRPHVLHFHSLPLAGAPVSWFCGAATVLTIHLVALAPRDRVVLSAYGPAVRGVIAVSPEVMAAYAEADVLRGAAWQVISNGVEAGVFYPASEWKPPSPTPGLIAVGRVEADKQVEDAIEALTLLRRGGHAARLRVVGDGSQLPCLKALAQARDLGDAVEFMGRRIEVAELMRSSDALVLTSQAETFGLVALEAMACGVPVVAYPMRGGINSWMKDGQNAVICGSRSPAALAQALKALLGDAGRLQRLREAGLSTARQFSAANTARLTLSFYRQVCD